MPSSRPEWSGSEPADTGRDGRGGFRDGFRRLFSQGDNPLQWAIPFYSAFGIRVRIHLLFVVFIIIQLLASSAGGALGIGYAAISMVALFSLVLLHEYGHCLACRWVGGTADEILLWPLGGLAMCRPPHEWKPSLITTIGGPAVNFILVPILAIALLAFGAGRHALIFNPLFPGRALADLDFTNWWMVGLWWLYYTNLALLAFNVLCVMFPLDGGRIAQELLWSRLGYHHSMSIAVTLGIASAGIFGVFGLVFQQTTLMAVALFCGLVCWGERQRLKYAAEMDPYGVEASAAAEESLYAKSLRMGPDEKGGTPSKSALKAQEEALREQEDVDRILAKIASDGMASLNRKEKKTLERATERRRQREQEQERRPDRGR